MKEQSKMPEENPNKIEISNLINKEFKAMIIKILRKFGRRMQK